MGTTLQVKFSRLTSLVALLFACTLSVLNAQVPLSDGSAVDIRFTTGSSQSTQSSLIYSVHDLDALTGRNLRMQTSRWTDISEAEHPESGYYLAGERQFVSTGPMNFVESEEVAFFGMSIINESEYNFSELFTAFDILYNKSELAHNYDLRLKFRINQSEWEILNGAGFSTYNLETDSEVWNSFSIQLNINNIFIRPGDELDLIWYFNEIEDLSELVPLVMQRVEVEPKISDQRVPDRGSVIITEIMPPFSIDGTTFEYIELYNPTNSAVSLKGIEIRSSAGSHVIQRDVYLDPYQLLVVSNIDISNLPAVNNNYIYTGSILPEGSGRIELLFNSNVVANATFNNTEPGTSLRLDRVINAYDGYSSMRHFEPSDQIIFGEIYGNPGELSGTVALYSKTIEESGWHLISIPGFFNERLSRNRGVVFYEINGKQIQPDEITPFEPVFFYKQGSEPFTIFAEEDVRLRHSSSDNPVFNYPELNLTSVQSRDAIDINSPMVTLWDSNISGFSLQFVDDIKKDLWTPVFINREAFDVTAAGNNTASRYSLSRYLSFTLSEGSSSQKRRLDDTVLGFMEHASGRDPVRYDLPKLNSVLPLSEPEGANSLFISLDDSGFRSNSFAHLPYNPTQNYRIGLGIDLVMQSSNMVIEWDMNDQIPEEWTLLLEDTQTGIITDMREENSFRFRSSGRELDISSNRDLQETEISVLNNLDNNRFYIKIEPFEEIAEQEETLETPGNIELRPNYPNPFNPSTNISFYLPEERPVRLGIYNIVGQQVALLVDDTIQPGEHSVVWNAMNNPSGIYIVQLETGNRTLTRKITLIK